MRHTTLNRIVRVSKHAKFAGVLLFIPKLVKNIGERGSGFGFPAMYHLNYIAMTGASYDIFDVIDLSQYICTEVKHSSYR